jgi:predicted DsbA family dithiol-disulfide isomerase
MQVEIWSDVVCPWCYIGKRRFEEALAEFAHAEDIEVRWRSFELDPSAPATVDVDLIDRLAGKYGVSREQALAMNDRVTRIADEVGLSYRLDIAKPGNTFDAHRVLHLAADRGVQGDLKERLLAAYQSNGEAIADHGTLVRAAVAAGLDEPEVRAVLDGDAYGDEVREDEREARSLGITGVPFFVLDRKYAVSGAQPSDVLLRALEQAWADRSPLRVVAGAADGGDGGDACGPDGCELPA